MSTWPIRPRRRYAASARSTCAKASSTRPYRDKKVHVRRLGAGDSNHIVGLCEHGQRLVEESRRSVRSELSARHERQDELDAGAKLDRSVTRDAGTARRGFEELDRLIEPPDAPQRRPQTALDLDPVQRLLVEERRRTLEQVRSRRVVEGQERAFAGGRETRRCVVRECGAPRRVAAVVRGTLEVRPDELVALAALVEPAGERLVHRRALRTADRVVGGASHERMHELVVVAARTDEPAPLERREAAAELACLGIRRQRAERLARERAPDDRGPREDGALAGLQHVDAAREQRVEAHRDPLVREVGLRRVRGELLDEERDALGRVEDRGRERVVEHLALRERVDEEPGLVAAERVEYRGALAPGRAPLEELGPRHRDDEHGAVDSADDVLDEVEEGRDGPVEVVEHDDDRALGGEVPEERAGGRERRVGALELAERRGRPRRARRRGRPARGAAGR